jgi:monoamine oxidase
VAAAAVVTGLAACGERRVAPDPVGVPPAAPTSQPRIVVVGAGLAGMTCAHRLHQAGLRCTVYEAEAKPGGRTRTLRGFFADGQLAESGGEFVDSRHTALWQLVSELGLELDDLWLAAPDGAELFRLGGRRYSLARADEDWRAAYDAVQADAAAAGDEPRFDQSTQAARRIDHMSAAEWIDARIPGGRASLLGSLLDVIWTTESGADTGELSALTLVRALAESPRVAFWPVGDSDERFHVRGGNDQVVARIEERLPDGSLRTDSALAAVRALDSGESVCTFEEDGRLADVRCDRLVLALPFTALREVDTSRAGFRPLKRRAIEELPLGTSSKLHLEFERRLWREQGLDGWTETGRLQTTWEETVAQPGAGGVLVVYNGGAAGAGWDPAPAHGPADATVVAPALAVLDRLVPGLEAAWTGRAWLDYWRASPWHRGAYSYYAVGQTTRFRGVEGLREGNVHFAGEHTSLAFRGYMEGAVESGERVASEILGDYGG